MRSGSAAGGSCDSRRNVSSILSASRREKPNWRLTRARSGADDGEHEEPSDGPQERVRRLLDVGEEPEQPLGLDGDEEGPRREEDAARAGPGGAAAAGADPQGEGDERQGEGRFHPPAARLLPS